MTKLKTVNIKGKEYVEVHTRLKYFRSKYPQYTIDTDTIEKTEDTVMFKAVIKRNFHYLMCFESSFFTEDLIEYFCSKFLTNLSSPNALF